MKMKVPSIHHWAYHQSDYGFLKGGHPGIILIDYYCPLIIRCILSLETHVSLGL